MAKQPLTPAGVQLKLDELYNLPDHDLQMEAESLRSDYQGWHSLNFSLTTEQASYLAALNPGFVDYAAVNSSFALDCPLTVIRRYTYRSSQSLFFGCFKK